MKLGPLEIALIVGFTLAMGAVAVAVALIVWFYLSRKSAPSSERRRNTSSGFCPKCGEQLIPGSNFCTRCGASVT